MQLFLQCCVWPLEANWRRIVKFPILLITWAALDLKENEIIAILLVGGQYSPFKLDELLQDKPAPKFLNGDPYKLSQKPRRFLKT